MPPRLNKRQQRADEELLALGTHDAASASSEEESVLVPPKKAGGFAALLMDDDPEEDSEEEADVDQTRPAKSKKKKKKKASKAATPAETVTATPSGPPTPAPAAVAAAKASKKAAKKAKEKKDEGDELDKALAELSVKYPDLQDVAASAASATHGATSTAQAFASLISISPQHLDPDAELKRFFGSKVVASANAESSATSSRGRGRRGAGGPAGGAGTRSILCKPKNTWWPAQLREGLSLRALDRSELEEKARRHGWGGVVPGTGERWWTVEYSKKYRGVTMAFMQTVMSGDPEGFWGLLRLLCYHADTLLQLAEGYRYREEHSSAMDFIDRALYAYERAFVGAFTFTSGANRLDFNRAENRPLFLALHRQVVDLQRRGCFRTATEFAKLLYSLDPAGDPHGALLHLDFLALKSGLHEWLLEIWDFWAARREEGEKSAYAGRVNVTALPGWAFARAVALRTQESAVKGKTKNHDASTSALKEAIMKFPTVVPVLADKSDITLSSEARAHPAFRISTDSGAFNKNSECSLHILSHLYAQRSAPLWKASPALGQWLSDAVQAVLPNLPSKAQTSDELFTALFDKEDLALSVYRHVVVQEAAFRNLLTFVPRAVAATTTFAGDPVPPDPSTLVSTYDAAFFAGSEDALGGFARPRNRRQEQRVLEQMIPDAGMRGQLLDAFAAHPQLARNFPGGVVQFVQFAAENEDMFNALLVELAQAGPPEQAGMRGEDEGRMPGGMEVEEARWEIDFNAIPEERADAGRPPAVHGADEDAMEENEDDAEEDVAPMPVRVLRNVLNRFWGGGEAPDDESTDEDDTELRDQQGVD